MADRKNVIVLTSGLTGSSVLTSMFVRNGYWPGDETVQKRDYDTMENAELVALNKSILRAVGFEEDWMMNFRPEYIQFVVDSAESLDPAPFEAFVQTCNRNQPWIWKDPRLWLTIRCWRRFLDLDEIVFPVIYRDPLQAWISSVLRWKIKSFKASREYRANVRSSIVEFAESEGTDYLELLYEDLMAQPERIIEQINRLASTNLSVDDFHGVYRGTPNRRQHGVIDLGRAVLRYIRNVKSI